MSRLSDWLNEDIALFGAGKATPPQPASDAPAAEAQEVQAKPADPRLVPNYSSLIENRTADFTITLLAGDFSTATGHNKAAVKGRAIVVPSTELGPRFLGIGIPQAVRYEISEIEEASILSEESRRGMVNTIGWGTLGAVIAGPLAALGAGALANTKKDWVQVAVRFRDGKAFLGEIKKKYMPIFEFNLKGAGCRLDR